MKRLAPTSESYSVSKVIHDQLIPDMPKKTLSSNPKCKGPRREQSSEHGESNGGSDNVVVGARKSAGVAESGPEVEAVHGPKQRKQSEPELVEPTGVADRFFLRQTQRTVDGGPDG